MTVILLIAFAIAVSLPALVLGCECLLAVFPLRRERRSELGERSSLAVIVPAHNEEAGIAATLNAILPQLDSDDRLIVVADNCEDQTAAIARSLGATVWERTDAERRGKGFAIRHALSELESDPPQAVITIDADCLPLPGCVDRIARACNATGNPIQAAYLMRPPENASPGTLISAFAVLVKNYVRPRGLQRLRMPCLITGSGVAYPWAILQQVPHPESHIVEDMHYSVDLALAGTPPLPCMEAFVESQLPDARQAAQTQRTRWEHGHLSVILSQGPRLLAGALRNLSVSMFVLWLELIVPPLSLLVLAMSAATVAMAIACVLVGNWLPLAWLVGVSSIGVIGLSLAWWRFGRRALPLTALVSVPKYVLSKLAIYRKFVASPEQSWVRTAREPVTTESIPTGGPHFDTTPAPAKRTTSVD